MNMHVACDQFYESFNPIQNSSSENDSRYNSPLKSFDENETNFDMTEEVNQELFSSKGRRSSIISIE